MQMKGLITGPKPQKSNLVVRLEQEPDCLAFTGTKIIFIYNSRILLNSEILSKRYSVITICTEI